MSPSRPVPAAPLSPGTPEWTRLAEEYRGVIAMIQDTGRNIWVINGAYLVIMGLLAKPYLDVAIAPTTNSLMLRGGVGFALALLWLASFERNYAFYNFRIRFARSLEERLGLQSFTLGAVLGEDGVVAVPGQKPVTMAGIGKLGSIQSFTRLLIGAFLVGFAISLAVGIARALAA